MPMNAASSEAPVRVTYADLGVDDIQISRFRVA